MARIKVVKFGNLAEYRAYVTDCLERGYDPCNKNEAFAIERENRIDYELITVCKNAKTAVRRFATAFELDGVLKDLETGEWGKYVKDIIAAECEECTGSLEVLYPDSMLSPNCNIACMKMDRNSDEWWVFGKTTKA